MEGAVLALGCRALEGLLYDVFGDDGLAAMRLVLWRLGLKIKTKGTCALGFVRLKSRQFTELFPCHHHDSPLIISMLKRVF